MTASYLLNLPETDYLEALKLQRDAVQARIDGRLDRDLIIMLEHPPVFTLGRRGGRDNLLVSEQTLKEKGIAVVPIERGGDITYHGPGQLVVYPLIHLSGRNIKVVTFVDMLEQAMIRTIARWDIQAGGDAGNRGVWIENRKIGSIGITVRRSISFHGLALNVNTDLTPFTWINPCGIQACEMTTMEKEIGRPVDIRMVRQELAQQLASILQIFLEPIDRMVLEGIK